MRLGESAIWLHGWYDYTPWSVPFFSILSTLSTSTLANWNCLNWFPMKTSNLSWLFLLEFHNPRVFVKDSTLIWEKIFNKHNRCVVVSSDSQQFHQPGLENYQVHAMYGIFTYIPLTCMINLPHITSWWLNQPTWNILVKMDHLPQARLNMK